MKKLHAETKKKMEAEQDAQYLVFKQKKADYQNAEVNKYLDFQNKAAAISKRKQQEFLEKADREFIALQQQMEERRQQIEKSIEDQSIDFLQPAVCDSRINFFHKNWWSWIGISQTARSSSWRIGFCWTSATKLILEKIRREAAGLISQHQADMARKQKQYAKNLAALDRDFQQQKKQRLEQQVQDEISRSSTSERRFLPSNILGHGDFLTKEEFVQRLGPEQGFVMWRFVGINRKQFESAGGNFGSQSLLAMLQAVMHQPDDCIINLIGSLQSDFSASLGVVNVSASSATSRTPAPDVPNSIRHQIDSPSASPRTPAVVNSRLSPGANGLVPQLARRKHAERPRGRLCSVRGYFPREG